MGTGDAGTAGSPSAMIPAENRLGRKAVHELEKKVFATVQQYKMLNPGEKVLVAVSGGVDSMTLLFVLRRLPLDLRLHVFHLNHGLRPEAAAEQELVEKICAQWGLPCRVEKIRLKKRARGASLQERARRERYRLLAEAAQAAGAARIALGHQADDQVETVLMRFLTGAGPEGLSGIPPVRGPYIRPLLAVGREEILAYAREHSLPWLEDTSNRETAYFRNRIRHCLLPLLQEEYQPGLGKRLQETAVLFREWEEFIGAAVEETLREWGVNPEGESYRIPVRSWLSLAPALRRAVFRRLFFSLVQRRRAALPAGDVGTGGIRLEFKHSEAFLRLLTAENGKKIILPGGMECRKENDRLVLGPRGERERVVPFRQRLTVPGETVLPGGRGMVKAAWVTPAALPADWGEVPPGEVFLDGQEIVLPLYMRTRKPGDRFYPLGLGGSKKLKDYFSDRKIPRGERDRVLLLVDGRDRILWVAGGQPDARACITKETRRVLHLSFFTRAGEGFFYCGNNPSMV
ncbi:MAG: tRNA lysidine(34) synthetase TilS [Firmicutes bacterium]|nr:tRNA lysidine(34) synthetase TilS [Bacillota bacterium]